MGFLNAFRKIEKGFAWSFLGFVLAACFGALAIYTEFFRTRAPRLEYELLSNTPVLTTREDVPALKILYQNIDIRQSRQALTVVSLRVRNTGEADILNGHYDAREPLGVVVASGTVLEPRIVDASSEYLRRNAGYTQTGNAALTFAAVIMEPGEFFTVKFLVLHEDGRSVEIRPRGKVAGLKEITVADLSTPTQSPPLFSTAFNGTLGVQLVRFAGYAAGSLIGLFASIGTAVWLTGLVSSRRRKGQLARFRQEYNKPLPPDAERLFRKYLSDGEGMLSQVAGDLERDPDLRSAKVALLREKDMSLSPIAVRDRYYVEGFGYHHPLYLLDAGVIHRDGGDISVDEGMKTLLQDLRRFLGRKE